MNIKTGLVFHLCIIDHYCIMENLKENREKIRTNQEQYILKNMKIVRLASLGSNLTGSYKKRVVSFLLAENSRKSDVTLCLQRFGKRRVT